MEPTPDHPVRVEIADGIAMITMHRPEVRNAINPAMRQAIKTSLADLEANDAVHVIILTGSDPAFSAGIDLKVLGAEPSKIVSDVPRKSVSPFPARTKPVLGAINGPAITGGLELALNCDFLIASERAVFADTHARVGVMPGWGLTALLTDAVGRTRAREMSLTGNFVNADEALRWGLVNRVVAHDELMATTRRLAGDIVGNDRASVRRMLATYAEQEAASLSEAWRIEGDAAAAFSKTATAGADVESRRQAIIDRGRSQL